MSLGGATSDLPLARCLRYGAGGLRLRIRFATAEFAVDYMTAPVSRLSRSARRRGGFTVPHGNVNPPGTSQCRFFSNSSREFPPLRGFRSERYSNRKDA